jgi:hypothetical protein
MIARSDRAEHDLTHDRRVAHKITTKVALQAIKLG